MKTEVDPRPDFRDAASWATVHEFFRWYFLSRNPWKPNRVWLRDHVSRCHNAPVYVAGDRSTHWYACGKCGEATDPVSLKPMDLT